MDYQFLQGVGALCGGVAAIITAISLLMARRGIFDFFRSKVVIIAERDSALVQVAQLQMSLSATELQAAAWRQTAKALEDRLDLVEGLVKIEEDDDDDDHTIRTKR